MDDRELIRQVRAGDNDAFAQLVELYQGPVYNLALRMVGNEADAQDLAQEAFLRAWRALDSFQAASSFSTWLYRLTSNICIDFLRAQKRQRTLSLTSLMEDEARQWDLPDGKPLPEAQLLAREDGALVAQAMAELAPEYRQVLTLRIVNDCSYQQIAQILGIREGTVKSRIARAREQLRKKLSQGGNLSAAPSSNQQKGGRSDAT